MDNCDILAHGADLRRNDMQVEMAAGIITTIAESCPLLKHLRLTKEDGGLNR